MKKTLLQEVKDMNRIAGTQMTVEQEIAFIKNRLQELEFTHQASFDAYRKNHKMRPDTKVKIAGKETTVKDASKEKSLLQKIGAKLFGKKEEPVPMPKVDPKSPLNKIMLYDPERGSRVTIGKMLQNPEKYKHMAADVQSMVDIDPDGTKAQKYLDKKKQRRKDAEAERKEFNKKEADRKKWREENPELAKKQDAEAEEKRRKASAERRKRDGASDDNYLGRDSSNYWKGINSYGNERDDDDDDSGFGGFGGGSFGGGGASGDW